MFDKAVELILKHEGGYVNDPRDPGGETKYGISKRSYPNVDIKNLTIEQAKSIYKKDFWDKLRCDELSFEVAVILFDMGVNSGISRAVRILQKTVGSTQDGIIGPQTIKMANKSDPVIVSEKYTTERILFYSGLNTFSVYKGGWVRRSIETYTYAIT